MLAGYWSLLQASLPLKDAWSQRTRSLKLMRVAGRGTGWEMLGSLGGNEQLHLGRLRVMACRLLRWSLIVQKVVHCHPCFRCYSEGTPTSKFWVRLKYVHSLNGYDPRTSSTLPQGPNRASFPPNTF